MESSITHPDFKSSFEIAMAHIMIAYGSVALDPDEKRWYDRGRNYSTGSFYHSCIEASGEKTEDFLLRLLNGAKPVYEKCGPSFFGTDDKFDHTDGDPMHIPYAIFPVLLDDNLEESVILIAATTFDNSSFTGMLNLLLSSDINSLEVAMHHMDNRFHKTQYDYGKYPYAIINPRLGHS